MNGWFLGRIRIFRVRVSENGEKEKKKREKRSNQNEQNRVKHPFIQASGPGRSIPGPLSLNPDRLIKILMDLDQSNAPGALAW